METFRLMVSELHKVVPRLAPDQLPKAVVMMLEEVENVQRLYMEHGLRTEAARDNRTQVGVVIEKFEMESEMVEEEDQEEWVPKKSRKRSRRGSNSKQNTKVLDSYREKPWATETLTAPRDIKAVIGLVPDMGLPRKIGEVTKLDTSSLSLGKYGWMPPTNIRSAAKKRAATATRGALPIQDDDLYTTDSEKSVKLASPPSSLQGDSQGQDKDTPFKFPAPPEQTNRVTDFDLPADIANYSRHAQGGAVAMETESQAYPVPLSSTTLASSSVPHGAMATDPVAMPTTQQSSSNANATNTPQCQAVPVDVTNSFSGSACWGPLATAASPPSLATNPVSMPTTSRRQCGPVPVSDHFRTSPSPSSNVAGRTASRACPPPVSRPFHQGYPVAQSSHRAARSAAIPSTSQPHTRSTQGTSNYSVFCVAPPPHPYTPALRQTTRWSPGVASPAHYDRFNSRSPPRNGSYFHCSPPWLQQQQKPKSFAEQQQQAAGPSAPQSTATTITKAETGTLPQYQQRFREIKDALQNSVSKDSSEVEKKKKPPASRPSDPALSRESDAKAIPTSREQEQPKGEPSEEYNDAQTVPVSSTCATSNDETNTSPPEQGNGSEILPEQGNSSKMPEQGNGSEILPEQGNSSKMPEQSNSSKMQTQNMNVEKLQMYLSGADCPKKRKRKLGSPQTPNLSSPPPSPSQSDAPNKKTKYISLTDEELITSRSNFRQLPNGQFRVLNKHTPTVLPDGKKSFQCRHSGCGQTFRSQVHCEDHELIHLFPDMECFKCCVEGCGKKFFYRNRASTHLHTVHQSLFGPKKQRKKSKSTSKDEAKEMGTPSGDCDKEQQTDCPTSD